LFLLHDALEGVGSRGGFHAAATEELARGDYAVANLHLGYAHYLIAEFGIEAGVEVAVDHGFFVCEIGLHGVDAAGFVLNGGAVAFHLLALEGGTLSDCLLTVVLEDGRDGDFFFIYFTGKVPLMVTGTSPPMTSRGVGTTVKFSSVSFPSLLQDDRKAADVAARTMYFVLFIVLSFLFELLYFGRKDTEKN